MIIMGDDNCPLCGKQFEYFHSELGVDTYSCNKHKYALFGQQWKNIKNKPKKEQEILMKEIFEGNLEEQNKFHKGFLDDYGKEMKGITKGMKDIAINASKEIMANYEALLKEVSL